MSELFGIKMLKIVKYFWSQCKAYIYTFIHLYTIIRHFRLKVRLCFLQREQRQLSGRFLLRGQTHGFSFFSFFSSQLDGTCGKQPPPSTSETKPRRRCRHPEALNFHSTAVLAAAGPPDMPTAHWESISLCFLLIHRAEQKVAASLSRQLLQVGARPSLPDTTEPGPECLCTAPKGV